MSYNKIINARIVTPGEVITGDIIYSEEGKIVEITGQNSTSNLQYPIGQLIDAKGAYVVPGGIDAHVHLGGVGNVPMADDFYYGSLGALAGGTTTVIDFCEPKVGEGAKECIEARKKDAQPSAVDYAFYFVFTQEYKALIKDLASIKEAGIGTFKLFTIYNNLTLTLDNIKEVIGSFGSEIDQKRFLVHAEDVAMITQKQKEIGFDSKDMSNLANSRPMSAELNVIKQLKEISEETGATICIAHTTTKGAVDLIKNSPKTNRFLIETCPHYLEFTKEKLQGEEGALYTMTPPLRDEENKSGLWEGILEGNIAILSTDHCTFHKQYKLNQSYTRVPCGVDGIQTRVMYLFSEGVIKRGLSIHNFVKLTSENAAKNYHMYPKKGCIQVGSDADLVLISEDGETDCSLEYNKSNLDYTIYEGKKLSGKINAVVKSGKLVYDGNEVTIERGSGKFIPTV